MDVFRVQNVNTAMAIRQTIPSATHALLLSRRRNADIMVSFNAQMVSCEKREWQDTSSLILRRRIDRRSMIKKCYEEIYETCIYYHERQQV